MSRENARAVAERSLRSNVRDLGGRPVLTAGARQFRMVWTRDACFAAGGLIAAGRADAARGTLGAILSFRRADGLLPRLLDSGSWAARVAWASVGRELPLTGALKPNYVGEHFCAAIDGNALACWAGELCAAADGAGPAFAREVLPALEGALRWYDGRLKDGLVVQPPFSDWQDSVRARRGRVFFTNLLYWRAHEALAALARRAGGDAAPWTARAEALRARIRGFFWDERRGAYRSLEDGGPLSPDGLLFAIVWGFSGPEESRRLIAALDAAGAWTPWGPRCAVPDYPFSARGWITRLAGVPDYHDRLVWLWQSALAVRALRAAGEEARAERLADALAGILERDGAAGEVYEPDDGRPVVRRLYRSEAPFSWAAAFCVEALGAKE
ncbi:MAG: hypothetical protein KGM24_10870 [Elusimicrobia bacterium]|nr:hypothetical protein [Elusimicrobiota bacterium]